MKLSIKKIVSSVLLSALALSFGADASSRDGRVWSMYEKFASANIRQGSVAEKTSEGQFTAAETLAYAMFFALTQKDKERFDALLYTVESRLCQGDIKNHLPYGRVKLSDSDTDRKYATLTRADLFLAYDLYTAYEFFKDESYREKADALCAMIKKECTYSHSILGTVLVPSLESVTKSGELTLTPNIFAPFVMQKLGQYDSDFLSLYDNTVSAVVRGSGDGYAADSLTFNQNGDEIIRMSTVGSFDALRFYLWLGLTCPSDPNRRLLIPLYENMLKNIAKDLNVPKTANLYTHEVKGTGPLSYMAATLQLTEYKDRDYFRTVLKNHVFSEDEFSAHIMALFALGFDDHFFRFGHDGSLILEY